MIHTLGILTGVTSALLTFSPVSTPTVILHEASEASISAEVVDFSLDHQVMSTYGAEIPTIQLVDPTIDLEKPSHPVVIEPKPTPKPKITSKLFQAPHPLNSNLLFDMINAHRSQLNLPVYEKDEQLCQIAESRLPELQDEILGPIPMHQGMRDRQLDFRVTENLIHMSTEEKALEWWLNSDIHRRAIESTAYTHSCNACLGNSCTQLFSNFAPKIG